MTRALRRSRRCLESFPAFQVLPSQSPPAPAGGASDGYGPAAPPVATGWGEALLDRAMRHRPHGPGRSYIGRRDREKPHRPNGLLRVASQDVTTQYVRSCSESCSATGTD